MVYLTFPNGYTEEEQMLQNKYQKLKKKKKALQQLKAPKQEPEKPIVVKRPCEGKDAKEVAKKLLKSGAISAIKVDNKEKQGFKRSKNLERKMSSSEKISGYQPFSQAHPSDDEERDAITGTTGVEPYRAPVKSLYESFVSARETENREKEQQQQQQQQQQQHQQVQQRGGNVAGPERPRQGNTIYVHGYGVTEETLRTAFSSIGSIINISMEMEKNCGFVTFDKMDSADKAISEMNGSMVMGIQLKVSLARRQPVIDPGNETSCSWSTIAMSHSQKGCHKDKRDLVAYDEDIFSTTSLNHFNSNEASTQ